MGSRGRKWLGNHKKGMFESPIAGFFSIFGVYLRDLQIFLSRRRGKNTSKLLLNINLLMNDDKNAHGNAQNENKLDQWIRQNIIGEHKADEKIVHENAPAERHPAQSGQPAQRPVQQQPLPPKKEKHGFFFGRGKKPTQVQPQNVPQNAGHGAPQQNTHGGGQQPNAAQQHRQPLQNNHARAGQPQQRGGQNRHGQPQRPPQHAQRNAPHMAANMPVRMSLNKPNFAPAHPSSGVMPSPQGPFRGKLRIIPLGGLEEIGKNCMALEYGNDIILVDMGFQFPNEDMLGVDYIIPDTTYLNDKLDRIRGVVFTHGHLDHIGGVPYLAPKLNFPPMYGTRLTMGLVEKRLEEFGLQKSVQLNVITADDTLQLGAFNVSFFRVNHSIPDSVGIMIKTPAGNMVHTGDFKFDFTPSGDQMPADFSRIASLAQHGIAAIFMDSTNALKPGYTVSEKKIGDSLEHIIKNIEGRIIIASFASQIGRIQQIADLAVKYKRSVFLSGRSLINNVYMAKELGYLKMPEGLINDIRKAKKVPEDKTIILTTGSQGEDVSALTRMALEEHPSVKIKKGDTVILSSSAIPGNERAIATVTNNLCRLGAKIINNQIMDVHTSGHGQQEDLKLMVSLVRPKYVVPIHGEYYMRVGSKEVAMSLGYDESHAVIVENGEVLEIENNEIKRTGEKIPCNYILIDGLGVGDIGAQVIMDRQTLAENGVLIVMIPIDEKTNRLKGSIDIISRGFIYMKESEELIKSIISTATSAYNTVMDKRANASRADVKNYVRECVDKFVHQKIERHPLVIPIVMEK